MSVTWKARLGVLLIFLLGVAAGGLAAGAFFAHRATAFFQRGPAAYVDVVEKRLTRRLHLDAEQKQKVHQLLEANLDQRKTIQLQIQPQIRAANLETGQQIKAILRPDQAEVFRQNLLNLRLRAGTNASPAVVSTNAAPATGP